MSTVPRRNRKAAPKSAPPAAAALRPGWTTTEFWAGNLVHLMSFIVVVLTLTGRGEDLSAVEAFVPLAAVALSAATAYGYKHVRTRAKLEHCASFVAGFVAEVHRVSPQLQADEKLIAPVAQALDPSATKRLQAASDAWHKAEAPK